MKGAPAPLATHSPSLRNKIPLCTPFQRGKLKKEKSMTTSTFGKGKVRVILGRGQYYGISRG